MNGRNLIVFNYPDAGSISSLMMGDDRGVPPAEMSEAHQSTIQEFTNQLLSSMATQFSGSLGGGINTTPAMLSHGERRRRSPAASGRRTWSRSPMISPLTACLNSKLYHIMDIGMAQGLSSATGGMTQPVSQPQQYPAHARPGGHKPGEISAA